MSWIFLAAAATLPFLWFARRPSFSRSTKEAVATDDPRPLVTALSEISEAARPTAFDQMVRGLWEGYRRSLATRTVRDAAGWLNGATIIQYWIRQILEVEPELAAEHFDEDFLRVFYRPEVAAGCGKFG